MRRVVLLAVVVAALVWAGCAGNTDPATNVTNLSAQLNAHGHTTGKPSVWWWEYSTVQANLGTATDTEVCGNSTRCGPAQADNSGDIPVSVTVTGLTPDTTYYFRACAQDQGAAKPACGSTLSFHTLAGTAYAFDSSFGTEGSGPGQLDQPHDVALDRSGNFYAADNDNFRINKYGPTGTFIKSWPSQTHGKPTSGSPDRLDFDATDNLYAGESSGVSKYNTAGGLLTKWGSIGTGQGQFNAVNGAAPDGAGNVFVPDTFKVEKFSSTGSFISQWGQSGHDPGNINVASGADTDSSGNVYVSDSDYVSKFTGSGSYLTRWSADSPNDVAIDSAGFVYVVTEHGLAKYSATGAPVTDLEPVDAQQFFVILIGQGLTVDKLGNIWVADQGWDRIEKFKPTQ
jgi:hypothetical protein